MRPQYTVEARILLALLMISTASSSGNYSALVFRKCEGVKIGTAEKDLIFGNLGIRASLRGFDISVRANGSDEFFGFLECRGDLNPGQCASCASIAVSNMSSACRDTWLQLDGCFLRLETFPFFWQPPELREIFHVCGDNDVSVDVVDRVVSGAAFSEGFWAAGGGVSGSDKAYVLAQCHAYVDDDTCSECLSLASENLQSLCSNESDPQTIPVGQIFMDSCLVRVERYKFFAREGNGTWHIPMFPAEPLLNDWRKSKLAAGLALGAVSGTVGLLCCIAIWYKLQAARTRVRVHSVTDSWMYMACD